jgi:hypothetical protein
MKNRDNAHMECGLLDDWPKFRILRVVCIYAVIGRPEEMSA